jgi:hypothetical protein
MQTSAQVGKCWGAQNDASLCLVKPHALLSSHLAAIVCRLSDHFSITAAASCHFDTQSAGDLLEVYKRALPLSEYSSMMEELCSGLTPPPFRGQINGAYTFPVCVGIFQEVFS